MVRFAMLLVMGLLWSLGTQSSPLGPRQQPAVPQVKEVQDKGLKDSLIAGNTLPSGTPDPYGFKPLLTSSPNTAPAAEAPLAIPASAHFLIYTAQSQSQAASLEREYLKSDEEKLTRMKTWGAPYFSRIEKVLDANHMPKELEFLAVIESELKSSATSRVGAKGMWQFMPETARLYGLRVNGQVDERTNVEKSTRAAVRYLQDLYDELHDWLLVIAAYDGGTAAIHSAIRKAGSRNFWDLQYYLPNESRIHVKRFLATNFFMEPSDAQIPMSKPDAIQDATSVTQAPPLKLSETATRTISGHYMAAAIAKHLAMSMAEFLALNPDFDQKISGPSGTYTLRLPKDKMEVFNSDESMILSESVKALLNEDDEEPVKR